MNKTQYSSSTDVGAVRSLNEDYIVSLPEKNLWLVADGVGGHASGDVASKESCDSIVASISTGLSLTEAIEQAHLAVLSAVESGLGAKGMGSTIVAAIVEQGYFEICWVGDSRAYIWNGSLQQISRDHSLVQKLLDNNAITQEEALVHPLRNVITQSLGSEKIEKITVGRITGTLAKGELLLLCTDGLTGELNDAEIETIVTNDTSLENKTDKLIKQAKLAGGKDNISVTLISSNFTRDLSDTQPIDVALIAKKTQAGLFAKLLGRWRKLRE